MQARGTQLMIRSYEDLNLGIYFRDFGTFFWTLGLFWDFFQIFGFFSVSDFETSGLFFGILGLFWDFGTFFGILGLFLGILGIFFGIFVRVYEIFLSCEPLGSLKPV